MLTITGGQQKSYVSFERGRLADSEPQDSPTKDCGFDTRVISTCHKHPRLILDEYVELVANSTLVFKY